MNNKIYFGIIVDSAIDLITNSSSELFVKKNDIVISALVEMINAIPGFPYKVSESEIEKRYSKEDRPWEGCYELNLDYDEVDVPKPVKYYGISFDRDDIYTHREDNNIDVRSMLAEIGFELIDTDY